MVVKGGARTRVVSPIGLIIKIQSQKSGFLVSCVCGYWGENVYIGRLCMVIRMVVCGYKGVVCMFIMEVVCVIIRGLCVWLSGGVVCSYQRGCMCG